MIRAEALEQMSAEELVRFAQQRLALIVSANRDADETGIDGGTLFAAVQEAAREAHEALNILEEAPAAILNWTKTR